jgi:hypothetical protein
MHHEYLELDQLKVAYEVFHCEFLLCVMSMNALDHQKVLEGDELHA